MVARKGKVPELATRRRRHYGGGRGAKKGESENGRGGACRRQGSCGRTVRELRSAIKDKVGHVILMGVSWSEREEEV